MIQNDPVVFISYSHGKDEKWRDRLKTHLDGFAWTKSQLRAFVDTQMNAGDDWEGKIIHAMERTVVAVLLISPSFLKSDFIQDVELPKFLERKDSWGMPIVPIIVEPCNWKEHPQLRKMLVRPSDGQPLSGFNFKDQQKQLVAISREINNLYVRQFEPKNTITIVIADDRDFTVRGIRDLFNDDIAEGMTVVAMAKTPDEVERSVIEFAPDILLLDLSWYRDDTVGLSLIDSVRRLSPITKIIAISNHHDLLEKARKKGVPTLDKDFTIMKLFETIHNVHKRTPSDLEERALFESLTERENEVLSLVARGFSDKEIQDTLVVSLSTVKKHISNIFAKTGVNSRTEAAVKAKEYQVI